MNARKVLFECAEEYYLYAQNRSAECSAFPDALDQISGTTNNIIGLRSAYDAPMSMRCTSIKSCYMTTRIMLSI